MCGKYGEIKRRAFGERRLRNFVVMRRRISNFACKTDDDVTINSDTGASNYVNVTRITRRGLKDDAFLYTTNAFET